MNKAVHPKYFPDQIEQKWQDKWEDAKLHKFSYAPKKGKYYVLVELPYTSGDLHIGHWFTFVTADVLARFKKMSGENVFFPMGFDAIGLPAENAAIKRNIHPKDWTYKNIDTMTDQFRQMGTIIDWDRVTVTSDPSYMHWNQWIFLQMYEKGIAYRSKTLSNWCPTDQTVLANEHVESGKCWRCGAEVVQKEVEQWFLKITDYADKLLWENTDEKISNGVEWPKSVREGQNNWIGKSEGALVRFTVILGTQSEAWRTPESKKDAGQVEDAFGASMTRSIEVFTTRPDTLYGATFLVVSPEHPFITDLIEVERGPLAKLKEYVEKAAKKTELERKENKEKTGVFSGLYAINPVTKKDIPIWVADYVLSGYGTGAIMAVPAHDQRDFEFAKKFDLSIKQVIIMPLDRHSGEHKRLQNLDAGQVEDAFGASMTEAYVCPGKLINSGDWNGWEMPKDMEKVLDSLKSTGIGKRETTYHLHDWSVSRQRYWGTPVPIINCPKCGAVPVPEKDLPVELPYEVDYTPKGKSPLASNEQWYNTTCPKCGGKATRDAQTLDTFFDSSWYYYRYLNPDFVKGPFDTEKARQLMPLDIYFGGSEHILGHTLYARFFTKFFKDLGLIDFDEFAKKRIQHGIVLGPDGNKMSKSKGNVINPDDVVKEFGTDAVRIYLSFMMPYEATGPWSTTAMSGMYRFLKRVWDLQSKVQSSEFPRKGDPSDRVHGKESAMNNEPQAKRTMNSADDLRMMHKTIQKVGHDIEAIKLNTAVAAIMEWLNYLSGKESVSSEEYKTLLLLLAPFAPHITEELCQVVHGFPVKGIPATEFPRKGDPSDRVHGKESAMNNEPQAKRTMNWSIHQQPFPTVNEKYLAEDMVTIVVQVNGKVRDNLLVQSSELMVQSRVEELARESEKVAKHLEGKEIKKVIYVTGKILNFVVTDK